MIESPKIMVGKVGLLHLIPNEGKGVPFIVKGPGYDEKVFSYPSQLKKK